MITSDSINELAAALSAAQAEMRAAPMSGVNPHLRNRYATLNDVVDSARKPLADNGLSYVQMPCNPAEVDTPFIGLATRIMHKSGQWVETTLYFPMDSGANKAVSTVQAAGSILTYMRRYALAAALGIVADEDADGNPPAQTQKPSAARANGVPSPASDPLAAAIMALPNSGLAFSGAPGAAKFIASLTADAPRVDDLILIAADKLIAARADGARSREAVAAVMAWYQQSHAAPTSSAPQDDLFGAEYDDRQTVVKAALESAQGKLN